MDHALRPQGADLTEQDRVPYLGHDGYDSGPFLEYPQRLQSPYIVPMPFPVLYQISPDFEKIDPTRLGAILQDWLFFGLLSEFLGDLFNSSDFMKEVVLDGVGHTQIYTSKLPGLVEAWVKPMRTEPILESRFQHLYQCLLTTQRILGNTNLLPKFNRNIRLSLAMTAELLSGALRRAANHANVSFDWGALWDISRTESMPSRGWCIYEATQLVQYPWSLQTLFFFSKIKRPGGVREHNECSNDSCLYSQRHFKLQEGPIHMIPDCHCDEEIAIEGENFQQIITILENRSIPLLKVGFNAELDRYSVEIVSSDSGAEYMAISHVCADGLGNSSQNSLTKCRLEDLYRLQSAMQSKTNNSGLLLWIDTLCCPVAPREAKSLAIGLMRNVYTKASHVLVLDAELRQLRTAGMDVLEILSLVFTSGWMRRLWTYQEGALARKLWIQFVDGPEDVQHMIKTLLLLDDICEIQNYLIGRDLLGKFRRLRNFESKERDEGIMMPLLMVRSAVQDRETSDPDDEALCIGSLMKLDVDRLAKMPGTDRMRELWRMISRTKNGIPRFVIFGTSPRLDVEGYRWAPATFLQPDKGRSFNLIPKFDDPEQLSSTVIRTLTAQGLCVHFSGLLLERLTSKDSLRRMQKSNTRDAIPNQLHFQDASGRWYTLISMKEVRLDLGITGSSLREIEKEAGITDSTLPEMIQDHSELFAVILRAEIHKDPDFSSGCPGLLVKVVQRGSESILVRTWQHVFLLVSDGHVRDTLAANQKIIRQSHKVVNSTEDAPQVGDCSNMASISDAYTDACDYITACSIARISEWLPATQRWCVD